MPLKVGGAPWSSPPNSGDTVGGPLSVDLRSYIRFGVRNEGLTRTPEDVWAYLYLDNLLVSKSMWDGLLANAAVMMYEWAGLFEIINVSPGTHTLRMVVDHHNLVVESNEGNNAFEKRLTWETGPVPPKARPTSVPALAPSTPLTLPNLVPGWRYGSDGPIVISHERGTFLDSALTTDQTTFIDVGVYNRSSVAAMSPFSMDLYLDGEKVHTFDFSGSARPAISLWFEDWDGLQEEAQLSEGLHTLRMVIDPDNVVEEAHEDDNVFEKPFVWTVGPVVVREPITYSDSQLAEKLADLPSLLDIRQPALSLEVADVGYYLMTGRSLEDERVAMLSADPGRIPCKDRRAFR